MHRSSAISSRLGDCSRRLDGDLDLLDDLDVDGLDDELDLDLDLDLDRCLPDSL